MLASPHPGEWRTISDCAAAKCRQLTASSRPTRSGLPARHHGTGRPHVRLARRLRVPAGHSARHIDLDAVRVRHSWVQRRTCRRRMAGRDGSGIIATSTGRWTCAKPASPRSPRSKSCPAISSATILHARSVFGATPCRATGCGPMALQIPLDLQFPRESA